VARPSRTRHRPSSRSRAAEDRLDAPRKRALALSSYRVALQGRENSAATFPARRGKLSRLRLVVFLRQGHWRDAFASFARGRRVSILRNAALAHNAPANYIVVRDWAAAVAGHNRLLEIAPDSITSKVRLAYAEIGRDSDTIASLAGFFEQLLSSGCSHKESQLSSLVWLSSCL
jgi:hypothetical protein